MLIGPPGAGKSTLAKAVQEQMPEANLISVSSYMDVGVTLIERDKMKGYGHMTDYLDNIFAYDGELWFNIDREARDRHTLAIAGLNNRGGLYRDSIFAEIALRAMKQGIPNILGNVPKLGSVKELIKQGVYAIGLECDEQERFRRRLENLRKDDPKDEKLLIEQMRRTDELLEETLSVEWLKGVEGDSGGKTARVFDTYEIGSTNSVIIQYALDVLRK